VLTSYGTVIRSKRVKEKSNVVILTNSWEQLPKEKGKKEGSRRGTHKEVWERDLEDVAYGHRKGENFP